MSEKTVIDNYDGKSGYVRGKEHYERCGVQDIGGERYLIADGMYRIVSEDIDSGTARAIKLPINEEVKKYSL